MKLKWRVDDQQREQSQQDMAAEFHLKLFNSLVGKCLLGSGRIDKISSLFHLNQYLSLILELFLLAAPCSQCPESVIFHLSKPARSRAPQSLGHLLSPPGHQLPHLSSSLVPTQLGVASGSGGVLWGPTRLSFYLVMKIKLRPRGHGGLVLFCESCIILLSSV